MTVAMARVIRGRRLWADEVTRLPLDIKDLENKPRVRKEGEIMILLTDGRRQKTKGGKVAICRRLHMKRGKVDNLMERDREIYPTT